MSPPRRKSRLIELQRRFRCSYDATALLIYMLVVYVWGIRLPAMGRDFELAHDPGLMSSRITAWLFDRELDLFGGEVLPYHLANLTLLYACTVLTYILARMVFPELPIWLATLAAALFMANPVHTDGVLPVSAIVDLVPAVCGLACVTLYVSARRRSSDTLLGFALVLGAAAIACFPTLAGIAIVMAIYELTLEHDRARRGLVIAYCVVATAIGAIIHRSALSIDSLDPAGMFGPLYFILYPIGFLPENAQRFHAWPVLGWISAVIVVFLGVLIYRQARHRAMLFGVFGAAALRLLQGGLFIDPVHLSGGGTLLLPTAFISIALAVVFGRMMAHRKWHTIIVMGTTFLALLLFGLQIRAVNTWRHAGRQVREFQSTANSLRNVDAPIGVLPDYRYYRGAPLTLSQSISYDTAFSTSVPHRSLLSLHSDLDSTLEIAVLERSSRSLMLRLRHPQPDSLWVWPYELASTDSAERDKIRVLVVERGADFATLQIESIGFPLPSLTAPFP